MSRRAIFTISLEWRGAENPVRMISVTATQFVVYDLSFIPSRVWLPKTNYARMATKPPQITRDIRVLPQRAVENLLAATSLKEQLIIAAPTEYRLTSDLPYAWLVLTTKHIALCNTHRSRGIYAINTLDKLADVKITLSGKQSVVYLNFSAGAGPNLMVPLKLSIPQTEIDELREVLRAALLAKMPEVIRSEEPDTSSPFGGDSTP